MSEFQVYQFKSIDRPFTEAERREIGSWSSRTTPTATSATFTYAYGDFPKAAETVVAKYFDAMLYVANWGTRRLMFRLPKNLVDQNLIAPYLFDNEDSMDYIKLTNHKNCWLLDIFFDNEEGGSWIDEDDFDLDVLAPLRDDIMEGDYRALYLIWMKFAFGNADYEEEDKEEDLTSDLTPPPIPSNLSKRSEALNTFINFFEIDEDLVAAAQSVSPDNIAQAPDFKQLIEALSTTEQLEWLFRLAKSESGVDKSFRKRLQQLVPPQKPAKAVYLSLMEMRARIRVQLQERLKQESIAARKAEVIRMEQLAREETALWKSVDADLLKATGQSYDRMVITLQDLRSLANYQGKLPKFQEKIDALKALYAQRRSLIRRLDAAGL